jgi:hypothetical protein
LDFEVILGGSLGPSETVKAVREIHRQAGPLRRLFPWLQAPFIRTTQEWRQAHEVPHEWLTHSRWRKLSGPLILESGRLDKRQHALAQFRLCLRELTKTIPSALFRSPPDSVLSTARFNPDRFQVLANLGQLLGLSVPHQAAWNALRQSLEAQNHLTRSARSCLALHLAYQCRAVEALTEPLLALAQSRSERFAQSAEPDSSLMAEVAAESASHPLLALARSQGFELVSSSGGCRYSQRKLYLIPPPDLEPPQLARTLESFVEAWQNSPRPDSAFQLSYAAPIVLPRKALVLVHLGVGSCFEGAYLHQAGVLSEPVPFQTEAFARELGDGVFLLRKKLAMMSAQPERFTRYLQDYYVGVYPGLALALRHGQVHTQPGQAALRFCRDDQGGEYQRQLACYLGDDLYAESRQAIGRDPFSHFEQLEIFHRQLVAEL